MRLFGRFWREDQAQVTVEYILILSIGVMLAVMVIKKILAPSMDRISKSILGSINSVLFNKQTMHRIRIPQ